MNSQEQQVNQEQQVKQEQQEKDTYYEYVSNMWMKNKGIYKNKNGIKGGYYYTCLEQRCENPRVLNTKKDPEYETSIKSNYCSLHKAAFEKAAPKAAPKL